MAEILTDKNILPKSPTELQKVGLAFFYFVFIGSRMRQG